VDSYLFKDEFVSYFKNSNLKEEVDWDVSVHLDDDDN
jgi:hypothetical protein